MRLERVYHPYWDWEEVQFNMWGTVEQRKEWLDRAREFTGDTERYGAYMIKVTKEWPFSCENALTDYSINRKAWIGHAAVALAVQCPEDIVRQAWGELTDEQRFLANKQADDAIRLWENSYIESNGLREDLGGSLL